MFGKKVKQKEFRRVHSVSSKKFGKKERPKGKKCS